jgi:hypothetical protein
MRRPWHEVDLLAVPEEFRADLNAYVTFGRDPLERPLLLAILCNSLAGCLEHGGALHIDAVADLLAVLNHAPPSCWGNGERVSRWITSGGLRGLRRADRMQ